MTFYPNWSEQLSFRLFALTCMLSLGVGGSTAFAGGALNVPKRARMHSGTVSANHGVWVYQLNDLIGSDPDAQDLGEFATRHGISDLYLSISQTALRNPGLPRFIAGLAGQGLRAEALMGEPDWSDPQRRHRMIDRINQIIAYHADPDRAEPEKFLAIHLDIEPWVGTGDDLSWLPDLIDTYRDAATAIEGTGMELAADINGSKVRRASRAQRQAVLDTAGRLVLMQYGMSFGQVEARTREFLDGLTPGMARATSSGGRRRYFALRQSYAGRGSGIRFPLRQVLAQT